MEEKMANTVMKSSANATRITGINLPWDEFEYAEKEEGLYKIRFPHSCVLYLRGDNPKECMNLKLVFPDGQSVNYKVPVLRM